MCGVPATQIGRCSPLPGHPFRSSLPPPCLLLYLLFYFLLWEIQLYIELDRKHNEPQGTHHPASTVIDIWLILLRRYAHPGSYSRPQMTLKQIPGVSFHS